MPVFHVPCASTTAKARAAVALERLAEHIDALCTRPLVGEDFERVESELHERLVAAEHEVPGQLLERLDMDVPSVELGGRRHRRVLRSTETYRDLYGGGGRGEGPAHAPSWCRTATAMSARGSAVASPPWQARSRKAVIRHRFRRRVLAQSVQLGGELGDLLFESGDFLARHRASPDVCLDELEFRGSHARAGRSVAFGRTAFASTGGRCVTMRSSVRDPDPGNRAPPDSPAPG